MINIHKNAVSVAKPYEGQAVKDLLSIVWPDVLKCCKEYKCSKTLVSVTTSEIQIEGI